jgi:hypothetical protein
MMDGELLSTCYRLAGNDFLASDLESIFRDLKTPEDIALHNVMVKKVVKMVGQDKLKATFFYRALSHRLLRKRAKQSLLKQIAQVLNKRE